MAASRRAEAGGATVRDLVLPPEAAVQRQSLPKEPKPRIETRPAVHDQDASAVFGEALDQSINYFTSRFTLGLSPAALTEAYFDWFVHIASAPGKRLQLAEKALRKSARLARYAAACAMNPNGGPPCIEPLPNDTRFQAEEWQAWPFNLIHQSFLLYQQWWHNATTGVRGVTEQHEREIEFATRQLLDVLSPSNFIPTNPEVLRRTAAEGGHNLVRGFWNFVDDWQRSINERPLPGMEDFKVGEQLALTPGKVVYRNRLIELIQYEPTTDKVRPEPVLVVPAWIMKYYILDLRPGKSLVEYLTGQGFTVFMISWKNPTAEDRDLGLEDYRRLGILAAIEAVQTIVPGIDIHGVGYCLGGTLLAIAAAALARSKKNTFKTLTFFAAQVDFEEAGELTLFINESQLVFLEDMMRMQGYLGNNQMAGAFQLLRSNDLIWSRIIRDYLMGERQPIFDLMAWNADTTRMPYRMHSEYLRRLYQDNELSSGGFVVDDRPVALTDIRAPVFAVGTETDHVAPWRSVYKLNLLLDTEMTFALTTGGHNAGVVSEPGHPRRAYRVHTKEEGDLYMDADTWFNEAPAKRGSWWPEWAAWLSERSGSWTAPPPMGAPDKGYRPLIDAPGSYVLQP
ncbi:MAG: alpha/beta fold hydrolase [Hyphomicrobiaceae bacterium]|nr:alpha/beta fold hydrolase [Hyphomicrobiaceae bacterium]